MKYGREFRIYKPNKSGDGAASKFQIKRTNEKYDSVKVFLTSARQQGLDDKGNAKLAWTEPGFFGIMLLGEPDIGELLAVLNGEKTEVGNPDAKLKGLFHKNSKGSTTLQFSKMQNGYGLRLATKVDDKLTEVKHMVSVGEAQILKVLLEEAVQSIYSWSV